MRTPKRRAVRKVTTATKRKSASASRTNSVNSLENGITILKYAIKNRISVSAASNANDRGKNYISDIKARLEENYKSRNISRELYNTFKSLNKQYQKLVK